MTDEKEKKAQAEIWRNRAPSAMIDSSRVHELYEVKLIPERDLKMYLDNGWHKQDRKREWDILDKCYRVYVARLRRDGE